MAEKIINLNKSTQIPITKPTYWNTSEIWSDGNKSYYIRQGNIVTVFIKKSNPGSGVFLTLPIGYRPVGGEIALGSNGNGALAFVSFNTDGTITASSVSGVSYIWATGSFYTADPFPYSDLV